MGKGGLKMWIRADDYTLINLDGIKYIKITDANKIDWLENGRTKKTKIGKKLFAIFNDDTFIDIVTVYDKDYKNTDMKIVDILYYISKAINEKKSDVIYVDEYK